jgi:hypothetical protein
MVKLKTFKLTILRNCLESPFRREIFRISSEARTDDEAVYGQYPARRTDEAAAEIREISQKGGFSDSF